MALRQITRGSTSNIIDIWIGDSTSTTGSGLTGLLYNSAGLVCKAQESDQSTATTITLATMTEGTWASGGFVESNMGRGWYQLGLPDSLANSGKSVKIHLYGATNMVDTPILIDLVGYDNQSAEVPADAQKIVGQVPTMVALPNSTLPALLVAAGGLTDQNNGNTVEFDNSATNGSMPIFAVGGTFFMGATNTSGLALATQSSVDTIDGIVDAILVDTAEIGTAGAGLTNIPKTGYKLASDGLDSPLGNSTAAAKLGKSADTILTGTVDSTVTPTTTQFEADDITEATADHYKNRVVIFTSGALARQVASITAYSLVSGRGRFTVSTLTEAPANNDTFIIV